MFGWLKALPDDAVRRSPVLSVFYGYMLMVSGDLDGGRAPTRRRGTRAGCRTRRADAPRGLTPRSSGRCRRPSPSTGPRSPRPEAMRQARRNTPGAPSTWPAPTTISRGAVRPGSSGSPRGRRGTCPSALETFTQAVASLHAAGNLVDELSSTVVLADMWLAAGRPEQGTPALRAVRCSWPRHTATAWRGPPPTCTWGSARSTSRSETSRAPSEHLETAAALGDRVGDERGPLPVVRGHGLASPTPRATREEAITLLDQAEQLYRPGFFPDVRPIAAMKARVWIAQGNLSRGRRLGPGPRRVRHGRRQLSERVRPPHPGAAAHRAAPGTTTTPARSTRRPACWTGCADAAETSGRAGSLLEIRMLQALAHDAQGHRPQALESLAQALAEAPEPDGYVRLFLDEGAPMVELAARRPSSRASPATTRGACSASAQLAEATESPRRRAASWRRRRPRR